MPITRRQFTAGSGLALAGLSARSAFGADDPIEAEDLLASQIVDTSRFKRPGPYTVGVSAGYLATSWIVYERQYIQWAADQHKADVRQLIITDAGFNPQKQVSDIEDLMRQKIDLLIYWPVDEKTLTGTLTRVIERGVPTVNVFGGFSASPGTVANAYISQLRLSELVASELMKSIGGKGRIVAVLPIPGSQEAADQLTGLKRVLKDNPGVELLNISYGSYDRAKSKQIMENLLQRYPKIDGVFSPSGHMNLGIVEAIEDAGRLGQIKMSPGDELNGWLKWVARNKTAGAVTFTPSIGKVGLELGLRILKGEPVPRGERVPSEYITPEKAVAIADASAPDDAWAGPLPREFRPR